MLELREQIDSIIESGITIINWNERLEYVTIEHIQSGEVYHFQGDDYYEIYNDYLNSPMCDEYYFDEYLYLVSQNW